MYIARKNRYAENKSHILPDTRQVTLTSREKEVLHYLALGVRPDRIAFEMNLSLATIHMHIQKAKKRLKARTREHAVAMAIVGCHILR